MRRQECLLLLYEGKPPGPRERVPYPEGDVLYECFVRVVVCHGDLVTKYTDDSNGMGRTDTPNEAIALKFIKENTTIPVPKVISSDWDRITMEYISGQPL
ncbi:hypothetical protein VHEMI07816 [[Torrubiella] hemipterigena]|uniref:Aminoglycoside phosphotransferase domain-containing protein n=1 Tax=[Torrubiella] hemipterigena TaxID=1531966 RepID=A0A0A1TME2_9HYPO|nr:hypothetical protein VHEMI07816 [[Torrubiella] hemipterigena]